MRGETSGRETPHSAHARRSEKSIGSPPLPPSVTGSTWTTPSARRSAVSSESASRAPRLSRTTRRSTITSIVCLRFLSSSISSPSSRTAPFTRTRVNPWRWRSKNSFLYSPLRPRVLRSRLLLDRDRGRQPLDRVHLGLLHLLEELARIGRERLDVAALALGIDRVEGQRRFSGPREPRDDDELVARDLEIDVLEVVLAGAPDDDPVAGHVASLLCQSRAVRATRTTTQAIGAARS